MAQEEMKKEELTEEQREYLASFEAAMKAIDLQQKKIAKTKGGVVSRAYLELVRNGYWRPDVIAFEFAMCVGKMSSLSNRLRAYITEVGKLAEQIHTKNEELKKQKKNENNG